MLFLFVILVILLTIALPKLVFKFVVNFAMRRVLVLNYYYVFFIYYYYKLLFILIYYHYYYYYYYYCQLFCWQHF